MHGNLGYKSLPFISLGYALSMQRRPLRRSHLVGSVSRALSPLLAGRMNTTQRPRRSASGFQRPQRHATYDAPAVRRRPSRHHAPRSFQRSRQIASDRSARSSARKTDTDKMLSSSCNSSAPPNCWQISETATITPGNRLYRRLCSLYCTDEDAIAPAL